MIDAQRVDYIAVPTNDVARAESFYGKVLGLEKNPNSLHDWIELEYGQRHASAGLGRGPLRREFVPLPRFYCASRSGCPGRQGRARGGGGRERRRRRGFGCVQRHVVHTIRMATESCSTTGTPRPGRHGALSRSQLLERYRALPLPTTTDESWRFTDLRGFDPDAFALNGHGPRCQTQCQALELRAMLDISTWAGLATVGLRGVEIERAPGTDSFPAPSTMRTRSSVSWSAQTRSSRL